VPLDHFSSGVCGCREYLKVRRSSYEGSRCKLRRKVVDEKLGALAQSVTAARTKGPGGGQVTLLVRCLRTGKAAQIVLHACQQASLRQRLAAISQERAWSLDTDLRRPGRKPPQRARDLHPRAGCTWWGTVASWSLGPAAFESLTRTVPPSTHVADKQARQD
jgi:hypothetical protein